jgi:hypothetical protein
VGLRISLAVYLKRIIIVGQSDISFIISTEVMLSVFYPNSLKIHLTIIWKTIGMNESKLFHMTKVTGIFSLLVVFCAFALSQTTAIGIAFGEAVPLIPINTGNSNLNNALPLFYDCIEEAVDNSLSSTEPNYFKKEPTRSEVRGCYEVTIGKAEH